MYKKTTVEIPQTARKFPEVQLEVVGYEIDSTGLPILTYQPEEAVLDTDSQAEAKEDSLALIILKASGREAVKLSVAVCKLSGVAVLFTVYFVLAVLSWILSGLSRSTKQQLDRSGYTKPDYKEYKPTPRYSGKSINVQNNIRTGDNSNVTVNQYF